jgi:hypothetical protein
MHAQIGSFGILDDLILLDSENFLKCNLPNEAMATAPGIGVIAPVFSAVASRPTRWIDLAWAAIPQWVEQSLSCHVITLSIGIHSKPKESVDTPP